MADAPPTPPEPTADAGNEANTGKIAGAATAADTAGAAGDDVSPPAAAPPQGKAAARPAVEEGPQVLGGRLLYAILLLMGISAVSVKELNSWIDRNLSPAKVAAPAVWEVGKEARVQLTLVTADARRLNCAHDQVIEGQHCGFTSKKHAWPRKPGALADDNDVDVIQPYRTADTNALILVSGVWAQPELAWRVHREPPTYYELKKQARFVAHCDVRFIGELEHLSLRWETGGKWLPEGKAMVAKALRCTLNEPEG